MRVIGSAKSTDRNANEQAYDLGLAVKGFITGPGGQRRVFKLLFEGRERVLLTHYNGVFSSDDITKLDALVVDFVAREGYVRNIFDFTDVEGMAIPRTRLLERGRRPRMNPGKDRVIVAPQPEIHELYDDYARAQIDIGNGKLMVVQTLTEAFDLLRLRNPDFELIAITDLN